MKKPRVQSFCLKVIYKIFCRFFLKIIVGVEFSDSRFLKDEKQFIILANHNSHLDALSLLASIPSNLLWKVKPVAAEDYFGNTKLKACLSNFFINTLLIRRKGMKDAEHDPIKRMLEAIDKGYSLILFPEGTRGEDDKMDKLKPGIAHILSARPHLKYVPVFLTGMGRSLPKGEILVLPYKSAVNYGEPSFPASRNIPEIMEQITADFDILKSKYLLPENNDDDD